MEGYHEKDFIFCNAACCCHGTLIHDYEAAVEAIQSRQANRKAPQCGALLMFLFICQCELGVCNNEAILEA